MNQAGYLLDTNVLSEFMRRNKVNPAVLAWIQQHRHCRLYVSVITFGEIRRGVEALRLKDGIRAARLDLWLERFQVQFGSRILEFGEQEADRWGRIAPTESLPEVDSMLAATALEHQLTMVTRNEKDFIRTGVVVVNPWNVVT